MLPHVFVHNYIYHWKHSNIRILLSVYILCAICVLISICSWLTTSPCGQRLTNTCILCCTQYLMISTSIQAQVQLRFQVSTCHTKSIVAFLFMFVGGICLNAFLSFPSVFVLFICFFKYYFCYCLNFICILFTIHVCICLYKISRYP